MEDFLNILLSSVWHTTHPARFRMINKSGAILANPPIPDEERWFSRGGPSSYPYVRHLNGVSLFDFRDFDPSTYSERYPASSWRRFIPVCCDWKSSIWIEIDVSQVQDYFVTPGDLLLRWREESAQRHCLMPNLEAAVLGNIPTTAFKTIYECHGAGFNRLDTQ